MSTTAVLLSKLRDYMKMDPNDKIWSTANKTAALNTGYFQVQKDGNFNWQENEETATWNTIGGTQEYAIATYVPNFIRMDLVQFTDTSGAIYPYTKAQALMNSLSGTGRPSNYYIFGNKIGFYTVPDTSYPIRIMYRKKLPTLTTLVDSSFSEEFDDAIVMYAAYKIWSSTKNAVKTAQALQDYKLSIDLLKMSYIFNDTSNLTFPYQRASAMNRRNTYDPKILNLN